jgi:hypothetical protein
VYLCAFFLGPKWFVIDVLSYVASVSRAAGDSIAFALRNECGNLQPAAYEVQSIVQTHADPPILWRLQGYSLYQDPNMIDHHAEDCLYPEQLVKWTFWQLSSLQSECLYPKTLETFESSRCLQ